MPPRPPPKPLKGSSPNLKHVITWRISSSKSGLNPPIYPKYTPKLFECLLHCFSQFFRRSTDALVGPIFTLNTSFDVDLHTVEPFGVRKLLTELLSLKSRNYTMAPMGKILKKFKCHNSSCTQDTVVIFDSRVGFLGMAYLMAVFTFTPGLSLLPRQRNLGQNPL